MFLILAIVLVVMVRWLCDVQERRPAHPSPSAVRGHLADHALRHWPKSSLAASNPNDKDRALRLGLLLSSYFAP
jgi:hypothetical protein